MDKDMVSDISIENKEDSNPKIVPNGKDVSNRKEILHLIELKITEKEGTV